MRTKHILGILALLALTLPASPAHAGGVVTVCDEVHLLAALVGGGMVTFDCSGTIILTNEIVIAADTTIDGTGQEVTISGDDAVRVATVNPGTTFNLYELTVADGNAYLGGGILVDDSAILTVSDSTFAGNGATGGGGIFNSHGTVTVAHSIFSGNSAIALGGAIDNRQGTVSISKSTFSGNSASRFGGGIYTWHGSIAVNNSTFSGNSTVDGGGIYSYMSALTVTGSSFADNRASWGGGGIFNDGPLIASGSTFSGNSAVLGGGIYTDRTTTVSNSTFAGNSASTGGGIYGWYEAIAVASSTFADNSATGGATSPALGGGIYTMGDRTLTLKNTIVANNQPGGNCAGAIVDGGGNLCYFDSTCPGIHADPYLGPLQDNGGPTRTMALGPGSGALDAGDGDACAAAPVNNLDQRGDVRPKGSRCDIGAIEQEPYPTIWFPIALRR